jgi:carbamate kinase
MYILVDWGTDYRDPSYRYIDSLIGPFFLEEDADRYKRKNKLTWMEIHPVTAPNESSS